MSIMESLLTGKRRLLAVIPGISILLAVMNYTAGFGTAIAVFNLLGLLAIDFAVFQTYASLAKEQKNQYDTASSLRYFRHDARMHWNALAAMLRENRTEAALNYLSDIADIISPKWEIAATGNRDMDCILNYGFSKAAEAGIRIDCNIAVPSVSLIKAYDLNTILVNLLDNAIEAAAQCEQKEISLIIRYISGTLHISISNPYTGTIQAVGNKILSKKPEQELHGIGLESVRRAAGKYDGEVICEYGDGIFTAIVSLFVRATPN